MPMCTNNCVLFIFLLLLGAGRLSWRSCPASGLLLPSGPLHLRARPHVVDPGRQRPRTGAERVRHRPDRTERAVPHAPCSVLPSDGLWFVVWRRDQGKQGGSSPSSSLAWLLAARRSRGGSPYTSPRSSGARYEQILVGLLQSDLQ